MFILYGDADSIPAKWASGAEGGLVGIRTVSNYFKHIKLFISIFSIGLPEKLIAVRGESDCGGNTAAASFLRKNLFFVYCPFFVKKSVSVEAVNVFYHFKVVGIPHIKIKLSIFFKIIFHAIHCLKGTDYCRHIIWVGTEWDCSLSIFVCIGFFKDITELFLSKIITFLCSFTISKLIQNIHTDTDSSVRIGIQTIPVIKVIIFSVLIAAFI